MTSPALESYIRRGYGRTVCYWSRIHPGYIAGLRTASKGSSPLNQNQTRTCGASRSACASKSHQITTDGAQG
ncbi:hypothetical protein SFRURICE_002015 [Spodoptera frugiperda]|nr:hypothetical protein SFRURICE_002015 [Spodoptera frugiperda]